MLNFFSSFFRNTQQTLVGDENCFILPLFCILLHSTHIVSCVFSVESWKGKKNYEKKQSNFLPQHDTHACTEIKQQEIDIVKVELDFLCLFSVFFPGFGKAMLEGYIFEAHFMFCG